MKKKSKKIQKKSINKIKKKSAKKTTKKPLKKKTKRKIRKNPNENNYSKTMDGFICDLCDSEGPSIDWINHKVSCPERGVMEQEYTDLDGTKFDLDQFRRMERIKGYYK